MAYLTLIITASTIVCVVSAPGLDGLVPSKLLTLFMHISPYREENGSRQCVHYDFSRRLSYGPTGTQIGSSHLAKIGTKREAYSPARGSPKAKTAEAAAPTTSPASAKTICTTPVSSHKRKRAATKASYRRGGDECIFTGNARPDGAHIFPFALTKAPAMMRYMFCSLKMFWGDDAVSAWQAQCENAGIT